MMMKSEDAALEPADVNKSLLQQSGSEDLSGDVVVVAEEKTNKDQDEEDEALDTNVDRKPITTKLGRAVRAPS